MDTGHFIERAGRLYGYPHFVCDTGGSICEWVDGDDPDDPILTELASHCLLIGLKGDEAHRQELIRRFDRAPKPMCYQPEFPAGAWRNICAKTMSKKAMLIPIRLFAGPMPVHWHTARRAMRQWRNGASRSTMTRFRRSQLPTGSRRWWPQPLSAGHKPLSKPDP